MSDLDLWHIQTEAWHRKWWRGRVTSYKPRYFGADSYSRFALDWMIKQMRAHGLKVPKNGGPDWAWWRYGGAARPRPDLRHSAHEDRGTPCVLVHFVAPEEKCLLSDFDSWHAVLHKSYLSLDEQDDETHKDLDWENPQDRGEIMESWTRIFNLDAGDPEWWHKPEERQIQACLAKIDRRWVQSVTRFTAR